MAMSRLRSKSTFASLAFVFALALSLLVPARPATAAIDCVNPGTFHLGHRKSFQETYLSYGVSANLTVRPIYLCTHWNGSDFNAAALWTLITPDNADGWAQSGYLYYAGDPPEPGFPNIDGVRHFSQWAACNGCTAHTFVHYQNLQNGEVHQYWTGYINTGCPSSSKCLAMRVDISTFAETSFDPNGFWAGPWNTQYMGETKIRGIEAPGRSASRAYLGNMRHQNTPTTWAGQPCGSHGLITANDDKTRWRLASSGCTSTSVWTEIPF